MPALDPAQVAALLEPFGFAPDGREALVLVSGQDSEVLWASPAAETFLGVAERAALAVLLFGAGPSGRGLAQRLNRLMPRQAFRLERLRLPDRPSPLVAALHPIDAAGQPLALLHLRVDVAQEAAGATVPPRPDAVPAVDRPAPPGPGGATVVGRTRLLWEVDAAGVVTAMAAAAPRLLGAAAARVGESLPDRLRLVAPDLADRLAAAARQGIPLPLTRVSWPEGDAAAHRTIGVGCVPRRRGEAGLRGLFVLEGAPEAAPPRADDPPLPVAAPAVAQEPTETPPRRLEVAAPAPTAGAGNVVHFPVMRLGPVPANFVPALGPGSLPRPANREGADLAAPRWAEAPSGPDDAPRDGDAMPAGPGPEGIEGLSPDEQEAFEHIRTVLGNRPSAAAPPRPPDPRPDLSAADLQRLLDPIPLGLRLETGSGTIVNAALRDRAAPAPDPEEPAGRRPGGPPGTSTVEVALSGGPATLTIVADERPAAPPPVGELLDSVSDGFLRLDEAGTVLDLSGKAARSLGRHPEDLRGRALADLLPDADLPAWHALLRAADAPRPLRLHMGQAALTVRIGRHDGERVCVLTLDGTPEAEREGEAARREAERTSALKSEFLAKVSHEIRTPLNAILGFAEVIRDERLGPVGNPRYLEYLRDIHASGTHVMSLVNDLLDLSRIEAGRMDLSLEAVDANAVVQACVNTLQTEAHRARVVMRLSLTPRLPPALADERSLRQIVLNILSNAVKFNEAGGQVIVSTALVGADAVAIRVRDTGIGMTEDEIAAAMEPFRQLSTVNRTGSGLGLPLTKALVEANCASMAIKSSRGGGTLVEVVFPVVEQGSVSLPAE